MHTVSNDGVVTIEYGVSGPDHIFFLQADDNSWRRVTASGTTGIETVEDVAVPNGTIGLVLTSPNGTQYRYRVGSNDVLWLVIAVGVFAFFINEIDVTGQAIVDSLDINEALSDRYTCNFSLVNPVAVPVSGQVVRVQYADVILFGGRIERVERTHDLTHNARIFRLECVDWWKVAERKISGWTQSNVVAGTAVTQIHNSLLAPEGLLLGTVDAGPMILSLNGVEVSVAQLLQDVAEASGMAIWYEPDKRLQFRSLANLPAGLSLGESDLQHLVLQRNQEQYRNLQRVKVTGTVAAGSGEANVVTIERKNQVEITGRIASEGGTGVYSRFESIQHPTSNVVGDLELYGHTFAFIKLRIFSQLDHHVSGSTRVFGLRAGRLSSFTSAQYGLAGQWIIERVSLRIEAGRYVLTDFEATPSSLYAKEKGALLKIAEAGRAVVVFTIATGNTLVTFTSSGTWVVPGAGNVDVEINGLGPGGGGGGYGHIGPHNGGAGGNGGKAVSLRTYPAGTTITVTIQPPGTGGAGDPTITTNNYTTPGTYNLTLAGTGLMAVRVTARGAGGGGGGDQDAYSADCTPSAGTQGGVGGNGGRAVSVRIYPAGTVLTIVVGTRGLGGAHSGCFDSPTDGSPGTASVISVSAVEIARGGGGAGGKRGTMSAHGAAGAPGGGTGDTVTVGGGGAGGAAGSPGSHGSDAIENVDPNAGTAGGYVRVEVEAVLEVQANSGLGGGEGFPPGASAGAPGGGTGDVVVSDGGSNGGAGGTSSAPNGVAGVAGQVTFLY